MELSVFFYVYSMGFDTLCQAEVVCFQLDFTISSSDIHE